MIQSNQIIKTFKSWPVRVLRKVLQPVYYAEKFLYKNGVKSPQKLPLPDFLCIGVQKTGTSWLYENLRAQPGIFMPEKKELDYFGNSHRFYSYPLSYYSDYFAQGLHKIKGEATPYSDLPVDRIRFIGNIMPQLKLIITLRNPIDRLWSAGLMHLVSGRQRKFEDIQEAEFVQFLKRREILNQGFYADMLKNWRSTFPPDQMLICFYEDLTDNPKQFLQKVLQFLGQDYDEQTYIAERVNKSPEHPMPEWMKKHFLELYKPSILELSKEFGEKASIWLKPT